MITPRKSSFGCFKVIVLNPNIHSTQMDLVIGSRFFELRFQIEAFDNANVHPMQTKRDDSNGDGDPNQKKGKGKDDRNEKHKGDQAPDTNSSGFQQAGMGKETSQSDMK